MNTAKSAVLRAISAAQLLDDILSSEHEPENLKERWPEGLGHVKNPKKKEAQSLEKEFADTLKADGVLEDVPGERLSPRHLLHHRAESY